MLDVQVLSLYTALGVKKQGDIEYKRGNITQKKKFGKLIEDILSNTDYSAHLMELISKEIYDEFKDNSKAKAKT